MSASISKKQMEILSAAVENKIESVLSSTVFNALEHEVDELRKKDYNAQRNVDNVMASYMHLRDALKWTRESHDYMERYDYAVSNYFKLQIEFAEVENIYLTLLQEHAAALKTYADKYSEFQKMKMLRTKLNDIRDAEYQLMEITPDIMSITEYDDVLNKARGKIREMWNEIGETRDYEVDDIRSFYEMVVQALADRYGISFAEMIERERRERIEFDTYRNATV